MTWCGLTCCTRASCASRVAVRVLRRWMRRRCGGRNAASSAWCGSANSSRSSVRMRRWCSVPPRPLRCTRSGTTCGRSRSDQQEAAWLVGQPSNDRVLGDPLPAAETANVATASYSRPYIAHASMAPSCALAEYRNGHLSVWSHTQGVYPLRTALASVLGIAQDTITVRHAHGAGCYGHNGADDVAVDAAVIAMQIPDQLHPRAMAPRGGVRFRTGRSGNAHYAACCAGRCGKTRGLDCGYLVADACAAAEQRRQSADPRGAADTAAGSAPDRSAGSQWRRRHAQRVPAV